MGTHDMKCANPMRGKNQSNACIRTATKPAGVLRPGNVLVVHVCASAGMVMLPIEVPVHVDVGNASIVTVPSLVSGHVACHHTVAQDTHRGCDL